jgi:hypothetical protein
MLCATAALRRAITEMGTSASKICWPKNQKPPVSFPLFRCDACLRQRAMIRHKPPYAIRYSMRLPHFWQVLKSITSVALGHCVRHSPETGGPSDRNCSRASLRSLSLSHTHLTNRQRQDTLFGAVTKVNVTERVRCIVVPFGNGRIRVRVPCSDLRSDQTRLKAV